MSSSPQKQRVKVAVRVRPALQEQGRIWVQVKDKTTLHTLNHKNTEETLQYEFETVHGPQASQLSVYENSVQPLIKNALHGQNASVFAYGPTGAGKTHTILGTASDPGVLPRCVKGLISAVDEAKSALPGWQFTVAFSYMEIYNEKVIDLLRPTQTDLPIREDNNRNIFVAGLTERRIVDLQQFSDTFGPASKNRTTAATKLNKHSSRSHSILLLRVERRQSAAPFRTLTGKLYIIDLAGSEDNRRTGNLGVRLQESGAINTSLLALGEVVDALNHQNTKTQAYIPYRRSKLTRLLQDSLGGSAHSVMIVNLAPEEEHYFETYTTLHFARKTKKVVNTIRTNERVEKPLGLLRLKRLHDESDVPETPPAKVSRSNPVQPPATFLSPLLRNQQRFERDVCNRLQLLEDRILERMDSKVDASVTPQVATMEGNHSPGGSTQAVLGRLDNLVNQLKDGKGQPRKKLSVYSESSSKEVSSPCDLSEASDSPLFLKPAVLRRRGFKSTAAAIRHPAQEKQDKENHPVEMLNPDLQKTHNAQVLSTLNTGNVRKLQSLQKVGSKRAKLISDWTTLHGSFSELEDLKKVPGLTYRFVSNFLKSNLIQLDDSF